MENDRDSLKNSIIESTIRKVADSQAGFSQLDEAGFKKKIEALLNSTLREHKIVLEYQEQEEIFDEVISYFLGLGPFEKMLKDPEITEIMVNGPQEVYIEKNGNLELAEASFRDDDQLFYFAEKILASTGRRISEFEPYVDARLKDGSRVNIVRPPVSSVGLVITIRKFPKLTFSIESLIGFQTLDNSSAKFLEACVVSRLNLLICGGAGSGKTTLLNVLSSFIPQGERIITIEDTLELNLGGKHVVSMQSRPPSIEGKGEIAIRDLLKNALHMRPDRIIVGEVRSTEVLDMLQAMNTGHEGSMATLHASSSLEAMQRLEILVLMANSNISSEVAKRQIISTIDLVINMTRMSDGTRKIYQISELIKTNEYALADIFLYEEDGTGKGRLRFTGRTPAFYEKMQKKANYFCNEFQPGK